MYFPPKPTSRPAVRFLILRYRPGDASEPVIIKRLSYPIKDLTSTALTKGYVNTVQKEVLASILSCSPTSLPEGTRRNVLSTQTNESPGRAVFNFKIPPGRPVGERSQNVQKLTFCNCVYNLRTANSVQRVAKSTAPILITHY
jgi:hypothetical protein